MGTTYGIEDEAEGGSVSSSVISDEAVCMRSRGQGGRISLTGVTCMSSRMKIATCRTLVPCSASFFCQACMTKVSETERTKISWTPLAAKSS